MKQNAIRNMKLLLLIINPLVPKERNSISLNSFMEHTQMLLRMRKFCSQKGNKGLRGAYLQSPLSCMWTYSITSFNLQNRGWTFSTSTLIGIDFTNHVGATRPIRRHLASRGMCDPFLFRRLQSDYMQVPSEGQNCTYNTVKSSPPHADHVPSWQ
jgi:hypothetical protein